MMMSFFRGEGGHVNGAGNLAVMGLSMATCAVRALSRNCVLMVRAAVSREMSVYIFVLFSLVFFFLFFFCFFQVKEVKICVVGGWQIMCVMRNLRVSCFSSF